jgi:hypothetical protein
MTFRDEDRSTGAFRRAGAMAGTPSSYGACRICGGLFLKEFYMTSFGSRTGPRTEYLEEQMKLRELFSRTPNRCTCDPDGDRLFLQKGGKNPPPRPITSSPTLSNTAAELKILHDLLQRGVLTRYQYEVARAKLTSSYPFSSSATELLWRRVKKLFDQFTGASRKA